MALKVYDGYDHYISAAGMTARSGFLQYSGLSGVSFVAGPFGLGLAVKFSGNVITSNGNFVFADRNAETVLGFRWLFDIGCGERFEFIDSLTNIVNITVDFNPNNYTVAIYRGTVASGTLLYVTNNNAWSGETWNFIEIKSKIDNSTGYVTVKVNNTQIATVTGVDTQNTSAGAYWDILNLNNRIITGSSIASCTIDDLYYCDTTAGPGPLPYDDFLGDARCVTLRAIGNDVVQFTPFLTSETVGSSSTGTTTNNAANTIVFAPFVPTHSGVLGTAITSNNAAMTGHVVLGIYDSTGPNGAPGTLIVQATALTNPTSGNNAHTLASTATLQSGVTYYWAFLQDATFGIHQPGGNADTWYQTSTAYSGTMPANMTGSIFTTFTAGDAAVHGTSTITNAGNVSEVQMDSDTSYNFANTVTFEDLLNFQALPSEITLILAVQLTGAYRKDDAGTRAVKQALKSNLTEVYGSDHYLSSGTYLYFTDLFVLDPDTSTNWLPTAVNAAAAGYNVSV